MDTGPDTRGLVFLPRGGEASGVRGRIASAEELVITVAMLLMDPR
jgi:hypothetical protein